MARKKKAGNHPSEYDPNMMAVSRGGRGVIIVHRREDIYPWLLSALDAWERDSPTWVNVCLWMAHYAKAAADHNEKYGHRDDRRGAASGRHPDLSDEQRDYAMSIPASAAGGRGRKSKWRLAAEQLNPNADKDQLDNIVRKFKRGAKKQT